VAAAAEGSGSSRDVRVTAAEKKLRSPQPRPHAFVSPLFIGKPPPFKVEGERTSVRTPSRAKALRVTAPVPVPEPVPV
jgi:hypothetical protein